MIKHNQKIYKSQAARDAQQQRFGTPRYWNYLDKHANELSKKGICDAMTRSLSNALKGNDGM